MKRLILLSSLLLLCITTFAQSETDSTYTTFTTETINGYAGIDTCSHEWFTITRNSEDTDAGIKTQSVSRQCVKCGKQTTTLNIWKTYAKDEEEDTTGGN